MFFKRKKKIVNAKQEIVLEPFTKADIKQLILWITSPHLLVQWGGPKFQYPLNKRQLKKHIEEALAAPEKKKIFKVVNTETGEHIGHCELIAIDYEKRTAKLVRLLVGAKECRGLGRGEQITRKLLNYAFDELGLETVSLNVFAYNKTAIYCYQKMGFQVVDVQKEMREFAGEQYDLLLMKITKSIFQGL
ncbi:GNAT family N-acetyltransferase [bacterium]|nr:GNAT family N-acetyltransferase [bacterium]MBU1917270.1 GNAT family N-acetyltransferase [bacterium]